MKILVIAKAYPDPDGCKSLMYVHVRNMAYIKHGYDVDVINIATKTPYSINGISVFPKRWIKQTAISSYDLVIMHAPNIRDHFCLLLNIMKDTKHLIIFGHGHEFLRINDCYPAEYSFAKNRFRRALIQNAYDTFKLYCWKKFILKHRDSITCILVSEWMKDAFLKYVFKSIHNPGIDIRIIHNGIGKIFFERDYKVDALKKYDFITIRSSLDSSKYCIDLVTSIASECADKNFLIIGKGQFFEHNKLSKNVTHLNENLDHEQMLDFVDASKVALMPTKQDTQGVMTCELATYGIPVITSDIRVCREMLSSFANVVLIGNDDLLFRIKNDAIRIDLPNECFKNETFSESNTVELECMLFEELVNNSED